MRVERDQHGIGAALTRMADGLGRLFGEHLELARVELVEDARAVGGDLGKMALYVPCVLVGYGLLCTALVVALAPVVGTFPALLVVGGFNTGFGVWGIARASARLRSHRVMDETFEEVGRSASVLSTSLETSHGR